MDIATIEQGSEAWHELKIGVVSGTRLKAMMQGKSTDGYKKLVAEIADEILTEQKDDDGFTSSAMEVGIALEDEARIAYETEFDVEVQQVGFVFKDELFGFSPDGIGKDGVLSFTIEVKCPLPKTHMSYIIEDKLPTAYREQVTGGLWVTGYDYCDFISYCPGRKLFVKRVWAKDVQQEIEAIDKRSKEFTEDVKKAINKYNEYDWAN